MSMNPFDWIRKLAAAVKNGVHDALAELTPDGQEPPADLGELHERLAAAARTPALPAAAEADEPAGKPARKR